MAFHFAVIHTLAPCIIAVPRLAGDSKGRGPLPQLHERDSAGCALLAEGRPPSPAEGGAQRGALHPEQQPTGEAGNQRRPAQDAKRGVDTEKDGLSSLLTQARDTMNEIPEMD